MRLRIKEIREQQGLQANYVAKSLDLSRTWYSSMENNHSGARLKTLIALIRFYRERGLDLTLEDLVVYD